MSRAVSTSLVRLLELGLAIVIVGSVMLLGQLLFR
jgi:hypothetical protein